MRKAKLWFCEYYTEGSWVPINLSIGLRSLESAVHRGKVVCRINGYCAFWVLAKDENTKDTPNKVVYYSRSIDPRGIIHWREALKYSDTFQGAREGLRMRADVLEARQMAEPHTVSYPSDIPWCKYCNRPIDNPYHAESCKPYRVEVIADSSGKYCGNGLTFPTVDKASEYARDLSGRWTLVTAWRVVDTEGKVERLENLS